MSHYQIHIRGLVQGVGFRPFIYRIAHTLRLNGTVENRNDGVWIRVFCDEKMLNEFLKAIRDQAPEASDIRDITVNKLESGPIDAGFRILKSSDISDEITLISPDIAVCDACLEDMALQEHRINYPFINCTHCGPRFTIIRDLPYDRENTTMAPFEMCDRCRAEYEDIEDRRFHAQPIACNDCGPHYTFFSNEGETSGIEETLEQCAHYLIGGKIIAVKGLGGYFLACDALNREAVMRLRRNKKRENKPFAVMFRDLETIRKYAFTGTAEESLLTSWRRPIVVLETHRDLAEPVSMGFHTVGAMLPYMPFHHLLFEKNVPEALVLTSGNLSDEPIYIDDHEAREVLGRVADGILSYNREIYNRVDDSVAQVVHGKQVLLRRSRGYAPAPLEMNISVDGVLATGAELVNTFCLGKGKQAFLSQHIGDLKNYETYSFYTESLSRFKKLFRVNPGVVACDLHPDYLSTRYARECELPMIGVQHHHAHIASVMAEHGLNEPVIGVALDGTGYGTDGQIWGGEFLICTPEQFERKMHLEYVQMPGGDLAALEPWRMGYTYLLDTFGEEADVLDIPFIRWLNENKKVPLVRQMIEKRINTPMTSSAGRLFDAVAAITGICRESTFHAEAPMRLENAIVSQTEEPYPWSIQDGILSFQDTIRSIVADVVRNVPSGIIAARFHQTVIGAIGDAVNIVARNSGIRKVALSGGSFQNRVLLSGCSSILEKNGYDIFIPRKVPANDGGISLGQLYIAAARRNA